MHYLQRRRVRVRTQVALLPPAKQSGRVGQDGGQARGHPRHKKVIDGLLINNYVLRKLFFQ